MTDFNAKVMEEFRANSGNVEMFKGIPLLILHHTGAKSGKRYEMTLAYLPDGERMVIFASNAGAEKHPGWYHNLVANPDVQVELGSGETRKAKSVVLQGAESKRLYDAQVERVPLFGDYREKAPREIPVIALEPA